MAEDPIVQQLKLHGQPITRENYLELYAGDAHADLPWELEQDLPPYLRRTLP